MLGKHHLLKALANRLFDLLVRHALDAAHKLEVLAHCQLIIEHVELVAEAETALHTLDLVTDATAVDGRVAA